MRTVVLRSIASAAAAMLLLTTPAFANEAGWLSTSILKTIADRSADQLDTLSPGGIRLTTDKTNLSLISGDRLLGILADCRVDFAEDITVVRRGIDPTVPSTSAFIRFSCPKSGSLPDKPCYDVGFKLFVRPGVSGRYEMELSSAPSWSTSRCGKERLYAPKGGY